MNTVSKILVSAALIGAGAVSTPVWAQASGSTADTSMKANAAAKADANSANTATAPMESSAKSSDPAMAAPATPSTAASNTDAAAAAGASTTATAPAPKMAMNTSGSPSDVAGVGDTSKKYVRSQRAKDFDAEAKVTAQLNQKAAATAAPSGATVQ